MSDVNYNQYLKVNKNFDPVFKPDAIHSDDEIIEFYPHKSFIDMIKRVYESFVNRSKSIWVSGSYGTGKSYASWTLKRLIEVDENILNTYYDKYKNLIDNNIKDKIKFLRDKNVIVITRTGTSNIDNDSALCYGIQESVAKALKEKGLKYENSLKDLIINKFEKDEIFANSFDSYIEKEYKKLFGGDKVKDLLEKLKNDEDKSVEIIISNILRIAKDKGLNVIYIDVDLLKNWLAKVIEDNKISILFIWDEFTEYVINNSTRLSGFQSIGELISRINFAIMVITHKSPTQIVSDNDTGKKISDRFNTDCIIQLPEEQGIKLMASAINVVEDNKYKKEWETYSESLLNRVKNLCYELSQHVKISEEEYRKVLPLHPYAILVIRVISENFGSNQRSMLDFMKASSDKENKKGFVWFIENFGPMDNENPFLTVDLIWDYFYTTGKDKLDDDTKNILSYYDSVNPDNKNDKIDKYQRRILKTILLLNVIQNKMGQQENYYTANMKNIKNAFVGTNVEDEVEISINKLIKDNIINKIPVNGVDRYTAMIGTGSETEIEKEKEKSINKFKYTNEVLSIIQDEDKNFKFDTSSFLNSKYNLIITDVSKFKQQLQSNDGKDNVLLVLAYNEDEHKKLLNDNSIEKLLENNKSTIIIDATKNFATEEEKGKFIDNWTRYVYQLNKDKDQSRIYKANYTNNLKAWINKIENGDFILYYYSEDNGIEMQKINSFKNILKSINELVINMYPLGLEKIQEIDKFQGGDIHKNIKQASIVQGINGDFRGSLQAVGDIAKVKDDERYFINKPDFIVSKIKIKIDEFIIAKLSDGSKEVTLSEIYRFLYDKPFGFRNEGAYGFYIGFLLKEYVKSNEYKFTDSANQYFELCDENAGAFATSFIDVIQERGNYENAKIVAEPDELKKLFEVVKRTFNLSKCNNIGDLRDGLRNKMREYNYPLCYVEYSKTFEKLNKKEELVEIIKDLMSLLNNNDKKSENSIGIEIGAKLVRDEKLVDEFIKLFEKENVVNGIQEYIKENETKIIDLSKKIQDEGLYLELLKNKFTEDGNWLWLKETADEQIKLTLIELKIIDESNELLSLRNNSLKGTIDSWLKEISNLVLPFDLIKDQIKNENQNLYEYLDELYSLYKNRELKMPQIKPFYEKFCKAKDVYEKYRTNEKAIEIFNNIFDSKLSDFSYDDKKEIFALLQKGFAMNKSDWSQNTINRINEYKANKKKLQLISKFKEITKYENPKTFEISKKTPILIFAKDDNKDIAKKALDIINGNGDASDEEIEKYIKYIEKEEFLLKLNDDDYINQIFKNKFLSEYSLILDNVDEVRAYLYNNNPNVATWYSDYHSTLNKIRQMAETKYIEKDYKKVYEKIDKMSDADAKKYLKELIQDKMEVGISIMQHNK